ncbi:permease [Komagataeibacter rhaeticus]|uniref:Permease n=2 Tax=Komagataeibacter rhaeticus TaxID=215221 RepID=A0A181C9T3_9PROT|nr:AEC family transporter [Komagataeibacter rhaeticus]KDU96717.1 permease [Komagataeibacter rhaeticus AF1]MBL7241397.1 AEC family transporter [Komagataeibacter rhaeticus]PYD54345.1 permease [Komagataeibacter rhaeticus]QIP35132.1 permease [Komagataeibacter rhaeticus]QOC47687.1 AEC family transporter [Komagataeibacter rhaeticus]
MLSTIIAAMLPLVVVFVLGYAAGWRRDFNGEQVGILNRMVMLYAFPLSLFVGIARMPRTILAGQLPLAASVFGIMCVSFGVSYILSRHVFHRDAGVATLQGLAMGAPSVPFIGSAMLPVLIGPSTTAVVISASVFAMVLVQTPVCMVMLARHATMDRADPRLHLGHQILVSLREPIVWAPILATLLVACDIRFPVAVLDAFALLGGTAAGVALFASGIVLFLQRVSITLPVLVTVAVRNVVVPGLSWLGLGMTGLPHEVVRAAVLALSIPVGTVVVILAVRFGTDEQEAASTLFLSAVVSVLTMAFFIAITG